MFQNESAIAPVLVGKRAGAPMLAGRERHLPFALGETLPPVQLDDARKTEVVSEVADASRHHADFGMRQPAQRRLVKMIEVRVREQHEINPRQVLDFQAGTLDALQQEQPVGEIRVNQDV